MFQKELDMKIQKAKDNFSGIDKKLDAATQRAGKVLYVNEN